jgi:hypothetical protein
MNQDELENIKTKEWQKYKKANPWANEEQDFECGFDCGVEALQKELEEAVSLIQALQRPIKEYLKLIEGKEVHSGMSESLMSLLKNRQLEFLTKVGKK